MKRIVTVLAAFALALSVTLLANDTAREQELQQAIDLIESKGDLDRATPLLEDVARSADRALAARGLLYLAQSQERHGKGDALATYQRVVSKFGGPQDVMATSAEVSIHAPSFMRQPRKAPDRVSRRSGTAKGPWRSRRTAGLWRLPIGTPEIWGSTTWRRARTVW